MYDHGKFMTVSIQHLAWTPATIEYRQEQRNTSYAEIAPVNESINLTHLSTTSQLSDAELLAKAMSAGNGPKFTLLFSGDWKMVRNKNGSQRYYSPSEADQALCEMLAYWTGNDASRIDRLFRQSKLYRDEKWDRKARIGETYGEGTIKRALLSE
jgi:putative DNA primase/helicase